MQQFRVVSRTLKVDVIGPENIRFAGASVNLSARKCLQAVAVKGLMAVFTSHHGSEVVKHPLS